MVQDLHLGTDNVKFRKEKYYSASRGQTYLAPLPAGYGGEYGPNLKTYGVRLAHLGNMTEPKIAEVLRVTGHNLFREFSHENFVHFLALLAAFTPLGCLATTG